MGDEAEQVPTPADPVRTSIRLGPDDFQPFTIVKEVLSREPPEVLYHYTGTAGLVGIITSGEIWATHVSFLNDRSEMVYARDLIAEVLKEKLKTATEPAVAAFLEEADRVMSRMFQNLDFYVACLCEDGDLLSQWRGYSKGSGMYAMGFDSKGFHRPGQTGASTYSLFPVVYDPKEQRERVKAMLTRGLNRYLLALSGPKTEDGQEVFDALGLLTVSLSFCLAFFKHNSFKAEREWRIVVAKRPGDDVSISFHREHWYPTPYTVVAFPDGSLPLREVTCGPAPESELALRSVEALVARSGYPQVSVRNSDIPLRW